MKDLKKIKGTKVLSKNEQKEIKGGEYLMCFKGKQKAVTGEQSCQLQDQYLNPMNRI